MRTFAIDMPGATRARVADTRIGDASEGGGWNWSTDRDCLAGLVACRRDHYDWRAAGATLNRYPQQEESGYQHEQVTRPQTLGLALHDNPVGWVDQVFEKFRARGDTQADVECRSGEDQLIFAADVIGFCETKA